MENLFVTILNMSITASLVILAVLLARLLLRNAPKIFSYALWAVVLFRLLCPISIESDFSLIPIYSDLQVVYLTEPQEAAPAEPNVSTGSAPENELPHDPAPVQRQADPLAFAAQHSALIFSVLWLAGIAVLAGHSVWSLAKLRRKLVGFVPLEGEHNVRLADHIPSPFVLGLLRPKIYLPSDLSEDELDYILLHERTHIRRLDHITRTLAWAALVIHWFNPLVWLAFYLAGKDMEMSCDEVVLRKMGRDVRNDYSASLLRLSTGGKLPPGPLAFGGGSLRRRLKNILAYKKPALRAVMLTLVAVLALGAALATSPGGYIDPASVTAVTSIPATGAVSPERTLIYPAANRRQDLLNPRYTRDVDKGHADMLIERINSYQKTIFARGEIDLGGDDGYHNLYRISCTDGGYYLVDHWCWHGFSWNPLHFGEDDYTTLVTQYDSEGNAGITWQMEYDFDHAYNEWTPRLYELMPSPESSPEPSPEPSTAPVKVAAPREERVLRAREQALEGMMPEQIERLNEVIKTANLWLEQEYMYNNIFEKLSDPRDLSWNYSHVY